jgi:hypothetical protein
MLSDSIFIKECCSFTKENLTAALNQEKKINPKVDSTRLSAKKDAG